MINLFKYYLANLFAMCRIGERTAQGLQNRFDQTYAKVILGSVGPNGQKIYTIECFLAKIINPEFLRHRLFSFSSVSDRAVSLLRSIKALLEHPFTPKEWGKKHKGMQHTEVMGLYKSAICNLIWQSLGIIMMLGATLLDKIGVSKQITNRLLYPFGMIRVVITTTSLDNFFDLRIHDQAEVNIRNLAIKMREAINEYSLIELSAGDWHLPYIEYSDIEAAKEIFESRSLVDKYLIAISASRLAYTSHDRSKGANRVSEISLALDKLAPNKHWSPFEHQVQATSVISGRIVKYVDLASLGLPDGMSVMIDKSDENKFVINYTSRNLHNVVQARAILDVPENSYLSSKHKNSWDLIKDTHKNMSLSGGEYAN